MNNIDYPNEHFNILDMHLSQEPEKYLASVIHQRNTLAQEIKDFLVKTGGIVEDCCPNGPELIHNLRLAGDHFNANS